MFYKGFSGQSAIEYLMTYGWMLLVVAVTGGAIFAVSGGQNVESVNGFAGSDVLVDDFGVTGEDNLQLDLRSSTGQGATVSAINVTDESNGKYVYKEFSENNSVDIGESLVFDLPNVSQGDSSNNLDVKIFYDTGGLSNLTVSGSISGSLNVEETKKVTDNGQAETLADSVSITTITVGDTANAVPLNNDGSVGLIASSGGSGYVLNLSDPSNPGVTEVSNPTSGVQSAALSSDGSIGLLGSYDNSGYVLDLSDPSNPGVTEVSNPTDNVNSVDLSSDGSIGLLGSSDSSGYVLNLSDPSNPGVTEVTDPGNDVTSVDLSSDGSIGLLGSYDNSGYVLDLSDPSNPGVTEVTDPDNLVYTADLSSDASVGLLGTGGISSPYDGYVLDLADISDPGVTEVSDPGNQVYGTALNGDGSTGLIGSTDNNVYLLY